MARDRADETSGSSCLLSMKPPRVFRMRVSSLGFTEGGPESAGLKDLRGADATTPAHSRRHLWILRFVALSRSQDPT